MLITPCLSSLALFNILLGHDSYAVLVLLQHENTFLLDLALLLHEHHFGLPPELFLLLLLIFLLLQSRLFPLDLLLFLTLGALDFMKVHFLLPLLLLHSFLLSFDLHFVLKFHSALFCCKALLGNELRLLTLPLLLHLKFSLVTLANGLHLDFMFQHLLHLFLLLLLHLL